MEDRLRREGIRVELDTRDEKLGYKIRESQTQKVPYSLVLGDKEMNDQAVNVRKYGEKDSDTIGLDEFVQQIVDEINHHKL